MLHAFDLLDKPPAIPKQGICVLFGSDRFLQQLVLEQVLRSALNEDYDEVPVARFERDCPWADVIDEINTVSLFGTGGVRIAVVDEADSFVSTYRDRLEELVESPPAGLLIMLVSKWTTTTKLSKALDKQGLQVECRPPRTKSGGKNVDTVRVQRWLNKRAREQYKLTIDEDALLVLYELAQENLGVVEQGLAKINLLLDDNAQVSAAEVQSIVGGWKTESTWQLIDHAVEGNTAAAIEQLDKLLQSGEAPQALFGQIAWSLRRFALATHIYIDAEQAGDHMPIQAVLGKAKFNDWPKGKLQQNGKQMKTIGRVRGKQIYQWLCDVDRGLKGYSSKGNAARLELEKLMARFSRQLATPPAAR
jgi:DNA polymerase-3 subunit delta